MESILRSSDVIMLERIRKWKRPALNIEWNQV